MIYCLSCKIDCKNSYYFFHINIMSQKHKITPASYLIFEKEEKILLLKRKNTGYEDGKYSFVAGHVEEGESFSDCIIREAKEEAGILIKKEDLKVVCVMQRNQKNDERIDFFFTVKNWEGEVVNKEPHKCEALTWFDKKNLPSNIIPFIKKVIENVESGILFDEFDYK